MLARTQISHFTKLMFFKNKPQDLPYSKLTWIILLVAPALVFLFLNQPETRKFLFSVYCIQNFAFLLTLYYVLKIQKKENRFIQVSCNFLGISLFNILILKAIVNFTHNNNLLICLFFSWIIMLKMYVVEHSFNVSKMKAFLLLLAFVIIPSLVVISVMPLFVHMLPNLNL